MELSWIICFLIFLISTIVAFLKLSNPRKNGTKLSPGPRPLPIIGNLHQLASNNSSSLPHHLFNELARSYGPILHLSLGQVPTVVVSSADVAREVMRAHDAAMCSRPRIQMAEHVFYGSTDIGLSPYGEYWRHVRKIATLELFTAKRVQSFRHVREEEVANLVKDLVREQGKVVNLSNRVFGLSFDITSRLAFSKKGSEQEEFRVLAADVGEMASGFSVCDIFPSIKFLDSITGTRKKYLNLVRRCNRIIDPIIHEHILKKKQGKEDGREDLVDVLLKFHKDNMDEPSNGTQFSLTIDNIKAIVLELFGAGSETSSTVVEWAMAELLKNPESMRKAQDEVRQVLKFQGNDNMVDETSLKELKYLKQVIKETLRLHPPLPLLVPRESIEQCQILGYDVPKQTRVLINVWAIGKDPKTWLEPERFNPERFEGSSIDYNGTHFELIPFGAGRRICPGIGLGLANVELVLARLLYHFGWELPVGLEPQELNMDETFGIVARRKHNLLVIPTVHHKA